MDVFRVDRKTGARQRISLTGTGAQAAVASDSPAISGNGSRVVFSSYAQLLPSSRYRNCYLRDLTAGTLTILDLDGAGVAGGSNNGICDAPSIDLSGRRVAFTSGGSLASGDTGGNDIYVRDTQTATTTRISRGTGGAQPSAASSNAFISGDGNRVLFNSDANNLVAGDTNSAGDVFLAPVAAGPTVRVSVESNGAEASAGALLGGALNFDGSLQLFASKSPDLPAAQANNDGTVYLRFPGINETVPLSLAVGQVLAGDGLSWQPDISATGQYAVFVSGDQLINDGFAGGVYVVDLVNDLIARVSVPTVPGSSGNHFNPRISGDGTGIVWTSGATNLAPDDTNGWTDVFYARNPLHPTLFADGFED